jgi:hypothetical protein
MTKRTRSKNICMVCIEEIGDTTGSVLTPCGHHYCVSCFAQHMRKDNKCGYCRKELTCLLPEKEALTSDQRVALSQSIINTLRTDGHLTAIISNIEREVKSQVSRQPTDDKVKTSKMLNMFFKELKAVSLDFDIWRIINIAVDTTCEWVVPEGGEVDWSG